MQRVRKQIGIYDGLLDTIPKKGSTVAVLDSGIALHPDLQGRLISFRDFVGRKALPYDDNGHGTHVCGIICGSGSMSGGKYRGIAPASNLLVGKVLDARGDGTTENMLEGLKWIASVREKYNIRILNISVGIGRLNENRKEKALQEQLDNLWKNGIAVVCAAGNKGPMNDSISSLGIRTKVLTVGCHDGEFFRNNPRRCESYSGRGVFGASPRKPDLVAPGTDIISCNAFFREAYYSKKSGTSMATPIVSGVLALALQKNPNLSNEELRQRITMSARDLKEPWNKQGWGMVSSDIFKII